MLKNRKHKFSKNSARILPQLRKHQAIIQNLKQKLAKKTANLSATAQEQRCKRYPIGYWQNKTNQSKLVGTKLLWSK